MARNLAQSVRLQCTVPAGPRTGGLSASGSSGGTGAIASPAWPHGWSTAAAVPGGPNPHEVIPSGSNSFSRMSASHVWPYAASRIAPAMMKAALE